MYRLLAIADYDDRYVIPQAHTELADRLMEQQGTCGLDFEGGPGNCGMVVPESEADVEGFMLAEEEPVDLDIVKMAGGRRREGEG
jgi:nitrate reductase / nitrite oxidoreductase, beta subunit